MDKFTIISCVDLSKTNEYYEDLTDIEDENEEEEDDASNEGDNLGENLPSGEGFAVLMACVTDPSFILFFPIHEKFVSTIQNVISGNTDKTDVDLSIYKTMMDSWKAGNKFLSGIVMDSVYDLATQEDVMFSKFMLSDLSSGLVDGIVSVSFVDAVLISLIQKVDVIIGKNMLSKLIPEEDLNQDDDLFSEDAKITNVVKDIMSSPIQDKDKKPKK
jgi:hypothetical protein